MTRRKLSAKELSFLQLVLTTCKDGTRFIPMLSTCLVDEMSDGGMGGLIFQSDRPSRILGVELSSIEFKDEDGIEVLATINLDQYGDLFELDLWKTNFSAILRLPENQESVAHVLSPRCSEYFPNNTACCKEA